MLGERYEKNLVIIGCIGISNGDWRVRQKKQVVKKAPPVVEEIVEEEEIDPKFLADQQIVREVLANEHTWEQDPTVLVVHKQTRQMSVFKGTQAVKNVPGGTWGTIPGMTSWRRETGVRRRAFTG